MSRCDTCKHFRGTASFSLACIPCRGSATGYAGWEPKEKPMAFIPNEHYPIHHEHDSIETSEREAVLPEGDTIDPDFGEVRGAAPGRKDDGGKLDLTLLLDLPHALEGVAEVLQWAITKKQPKPYRRGSWQNVEDFQRRYTAAQLRHELNKAKAVIAGTPEVDAETELLELQHIATDAMFRLEMAMRKRKGLQVPEGA